MTNKQDLLANIWQQQTVSLPDIAGLKKRWKKLQWQQRLYYSLDVIGFVIAVSTFFWAYEKLQWFGQIWMGLMMVLLLVFTIYVGWLRRHALRDMESSTDDYLHKLKAQFNNNIKIAQLTKASTWMCLLAFVVFFYGGWFFETIPPDKLLKKIAVSSGIFALLMPSMWYWAHKREEKFTNESANLDKILGQEKDIT